MTENISISIQALAAGLGVMPELLSYISTVETDKPDLLTLLQATHVCKIVQRIRRKGNRWGGGEVYWDDLDTLDILKSTEEK